MRVGHGDEPALGQPDHPPVRIADAEQARQHPAAQVQLLAVAEHLLPGQVQPHPALGPQCQRQPVGHVDQVLILDLATGDAADQTVVDTGDIGARVVDGIGGRLRRCPAGRGVAQ
jgi:hypothetical protein